MSIKQQIAEKYGIKVEDLVAVIYYSDRSYTHVTAFGSHLNHIEKEIKGAPTCKNQQFTAKNWSELKVVPEDGSVVDALTFALDEGKILLVSGNPPKP